MSDKFKANIWIAGPAALVVAVVYTFVGLEADAFPPAGGVDLLKLLPYLCVIVLALCGVNVLTVLAAGLALCVVLGLASGLSWTGFLASVGEGIAGMGDLIIVTLLSGGMLELIRRNGGIDFIIRGLTRGIHGRRGAEAGIAALVGLSGFCTANNTIAILSTGKIAKDITDRFGLDPRKTASILDTFSCVVQGIIPYGAQLLMASSLSGIPAVSVIPYLYYPFVLFIVACLSIVLRFPRYCS